MKMLMPLLMTLTLLLLPVRPAALAQQQLTDPTVVKIKTDVEKRLRNEKTKVTVKLRNGSELKGKITHANGDVFTLKDKKGTRSVSYTEVAKLKGQGLSKGAKFGILTGIITGAVVIGALISLKNFDPFENGVLR